MTNMMSLIEKASQLNNNSKVVLIAHSNGGPTVYSFLQYVSSEWKEKFIGAVIGLSGNFLGQMNEYKSYVYSDSKEEQEMGTSWEGSFGTAPPYSNVVVVTTYANTNNERNYTANVSDIISLYESVGRHDWAIKLQTVYKSTMNRTTSMNVDTYCLYGSNVDTEYSYVFKDTILKDKYISTRSMDGDGNQDITDNAYCNIWKDELIQNNHKFQATAFPGVQHMQMPTDSKVLNEIYQILQSFN